MKIIDKIKNMKDKAQIEVLKELCHEGDIDNFLSNKIMKLSEECGEVNAAYLSMIGASNKSKSATQEAEAKGSINALIEEVIDVIMVAEDILYKLQKKNNIDDKSINDITLKKYKKWYDKIIENQNEPNDELS